MSITKRGIWWKPLDLQFSRDGFNYRQVMREGDVAIYEHGWWIADKLYDDPDAKQIIGEGYKAVLAAVTKATKLNNAYANAITGGGGSHLERNHDNKATSNSIRQRHTSR